MCEMYPNPEGADPKLRKDGEVPNPADGEVPRRCVRYIQNTCEIHKAQCISIADEKIREYILEYVRIRKDTVF